MHRLIASNRHIVTPIATLSQHVSNYTIASMHRFCIVN